MKFFFSNLRRRKIKKVTKLLRVIFPALGFASALSYALRLKKSRNTLLLIAKPSSRSKKLMGLAVLTTLTFFGKKFFYLRALSVHPKQQKKQIGSKLLRKTEGLGRKKGYQAIVLFSAFRRKGTHQFYKKHGFRKFFGIFFWKKIKK